MLQEQQIAPDFSLPDQNGKVHKLSDYKGQYVLVYFYPKDHTSGCTEEACALRDSFPKFEDLNTKVLGISTDSVESHKSFEEKFQLPFTLLADTKHEVTTLYGTEGKSMDGLTGRSSFLVDPEGKIVKVYENVQPKTHAEEVLGDLEKIK